MIGSRCSYKVGSLHTYGVRHQRTADTVSQQHPVPALGHAKGLHLLGETDAIGFLGPSPTTVTPSFYLHGGFCHRGENAVSVYGDGGILEIIPAGNSLSVNCIDIDCRHLCPIRQPVNMNADNPSVGFLEVIVIFLRGKNGIAVPGDYIIYVLVETQTAFLACLNLSVNIRHNVLISYLERGREAFAYGSNRHKDGIAHHLTIRISEKLVVELVIEFEQFEGRKDGSLLAYAIYI